MEKILIGSHAGTSYSIVDGTYVINLAGLSWTPKIEELAFVFNYTQDRLYYAPAPNLAACSLTGTDITIDQTFPKLNDTDVIHIQFFVTEDVIDPRTTEDYLLAVARGDIEGVDPMLKFGGNAMINSGPATYPEDVWSGGGLYTFTADGGAPYFISSSSGLDTIDIELLCLVEDGSGDWIEESVIMTLQGQTKVPIVFASGFDPVRFFRGGNDNGTDLVGDVYIYEDDTLTGGIPDTHTLWRGVIEVDAQQTEMCIYTIPSNRYGYFLQGYVQLTNDKNSFANFTYAIRLHGKVFKVQGRATCNTNGSNHWIYAYKIPPKLPPKTDIIITCIEVGANATGVAGGFDILLEDIV